MTQRSLRGQALMGESTGACRFDDLCGSRPLARTARVVSAPNRRLGDLNFPVFFFGLTAVANVPYIR